MKLSSYSPLHTYHKREGYRYNLAIYSSVVSIKYGEQMKLLRVIFTIVSQTSQILSEICKIGITLIARGVCYRRVQGRTQALANQEAQQRMEEFISIAGHELKTPLTSIKGNIQLVQRRIKRSADQESLPQNEIVRSMAEVRYLLEHVDEQIARLSRLINSFLEGSRTQTPSLDMLVELCELDQLIRDIVNDPQYVPEARTVHLDVPEERTVLVLADTQRIKQIVIHYLSNAHKFSPLDKPIEISLQEQGQMVRVSVQDKGPGIPREEQKHIWERFYKAPHIKVLNGSEVGLGLGLYISRTIVHQHQGQAGAQSMPGVGSTFWFTLPLLKEKLGVG